MERLVDSIIGKALLALCLALLVGVLALLGGLWLTWKDPCFPHIEPTTGVIVCK